MQKHEWIYESPDQGDTVYRSAVQIVPERELVLKKEARCHTISAHIALKLLAESPNDPAIKDMLDKLQVYWSLRNANN